MNKLAILGTAGFLNFAGFEEVRQEMVETPYGVPSAPLQRGLLQGQEIIFLSRNGLDGTIPPHKVNYRANIWALKEIGIEAIIGFALVNGIRADITPGRIVIPDQLIDYTHERDQTFFDNDFNASRHIDFRTPYSTTLRDALLLQANNLKLETIDDAVYAVTQGPHLETLAEINRLERDGCDMVGMSGMPETILARELKIKYACVALSANRAAGRNVKQCTTPDKMSDALKEGTAHFHQLIERLLLSDYEPVTAASEVSL